jgi:hypothetical protein
LWLPVIQFATCETPRGGRCANKLSALQKPHDLVLVRESACFVLGEDQLAVGDDVENASLALDELSFQAQLGLQFSCQTGSAGQIRSKHAVFDRDLHSFWTSVALASVAYGSTILARIGATEVGEWVIGAPDGLVATLG